MTSVKNNFSLLHNLQVISISAGVEGALGRVSEDLQVIFTYKKGIKQRQCWATCSENGGLWAHVGHLATNLNFKEEEFSSLVDSVVG